MEIAREMNVALRARLRFMENVVGWEGMLCRKRVTRVFKVTPNHVTNDLRLYQRLFPRNIKYDLSTRSYRPAEGFEFKVASGNPDEYLALLRAGAEGGRNVVVSLVSNAGICECLPHPKTPFDATTLRYVTRAIAGRGGLAITYQSLTDPLPKMRDVWPHALMFTGIRWYARCFDGIRKDFRDFALSRITAISENTGLGTRLPEDDAAWMETVIMQIVPNPRLSKEQVVVVAREYGMTQEKNRWVWPPEVRKCLVPYMVKRYGLVDRGHPRTHPVVLANKESLKDLLFPEQE